MTNDCRSCKDWRKCPEKQTDGFLFAHIRFCPWQVLFILGNSETLHSGKWPPQYSPFEEPRKKQLNEEGYFVKPAIIIAEVEKRLETCGSDGESLTFQAQVGKTLEELTDAAWDALMYCKGWRRKATSFPEWRRRYHNR